MTYLISPDKNTDKKNPYPLLESGWKTANKVAKEYNASSETWYAHMANLEADQIRVRMNNWQESREDAAHYVTHILSECAANLQGRLRSR